MIFLHDLLGTWAGGQLVPNAQLGGVLGAHMRISTFFTGIWRVVFFSSLGTRLKVGEIYFAARNCGNRRTLPIGVIAPS